MRVHFPIATAASRRADCTSSDAGLEFVVRYPVELAPTAEIDDSITRKLLETIEKEPKLKLVAVGAPKIQAVEAVQHGFSSRRGMAFQAMVLVLRHVGW